MARVTVTDLDAALAAQPIAPATPNVSTKRRHRHMWVVRVLTTSLMAPGISGTRIECASCAAIRNPAVSRRARNNRKRGGSWEREFAAMMGGIREGQLNLPHDVRVPDYLRAQTKQLDRWPSLNAVLDMLDAIPAGRDLRAVALKDTPGAGHRPRRIVILDADEYAAWHGRKVG